MRVGEAVGRRVGAVTVGAVTGCQRLKGEYRGGGMLARGSGGGIGRRAMGAVGGMPEVDVWRGTAAVRGHHCMERDAVRCEKAIWQYRRGASDAQVASVQGPPRTRRRAAGRTISLSQCTYTNTSPVMATKLSSALRGRTRGPWGNARSRSQPRDGAHAARWRCVVPIKGRTGVWAGGKGGATHAKTIMAMLAALGLVIMRE
jgi:hypothetical protein